MRLAALFLLLTSAAQAGDLRCGTHLITEGASQYELLQKCGEPVYKQWIREPVLALRNKRLVIQDPNQQIFRKFVALKSTQANKYVCYNTRNGYFHLKVYNKLNNFSPKSRRISNL